METAPPTVSYSGKPSFFSSWLVGGSRRHGEVIPRRKAAIQMLLVLGSPQSFHSHGTICTTPSSFGMPPMARRICGRIRAPARPPKLPGVKWIHAGNATRRSRSSSNSSARYTKRTGRCRARAGCQLESLLVIVHGVTPLIAYFIPCAGMHANALDNLGNGVSFPHGKIGADFFSANRASYCTVG